MTIELFPYGDSELWYASGQDWSLPLLIQWRHDKANDKHYASVSPAVGLYYSQGLTLNSLLQIHDIQGRKDCWLIPRSMVEALLHKAPGITALHYYKWPEEDTPPIPLPKMLRIDSGVASEVMADDVFSRKDAFIDYISERSGISSSIVRAVMIAISRHGAAWLLEKRNAIELGFCRLIAAPFRSNWKEIVACKFKNFKLLTIFNEHTPKGERMKALKDLGMPEALCSPHNIAMHSKRIGRIEYIIEAIPGPTFEREVNRVETKRMAGGGSSYVAQFEKTVKTLYKHLLDALDAYLHKARSPFARVCESSRNGDICLVPTIGQNVKVHGVALRERPVYIIPPARGFSILGEGSGVIVVPKEIAPLQEMPPVLQKHVDMRRLYKGGDLGQRGEEGTTGVPMLPSGEEQAS